MCRGNLVLRHPEDRYFGKPKNVPQGQGPEPFVVFCAERLRDKVG